MQGSSVMLDNDTIARNQSREGGGVWSDQGGANGGGGIYINVAATGQHTISRTTVSHNNVMTGDTGGGILTTTSAGGTWTLDHSYVVQNLAGYGVWNSGGVTLVLTDTVINDNAGGNLCNDTGSGCP